MIMQFRFCHLVKYHKVTYCDEERCLATQPQNACPQNYMTLLMITYPLLITHIFDNPQNFKCSKLSNPMHGIMMGFQ